MQTISNLKRILFFFLITILLFSSIVGCDKKPKVIKIGFLVKMPEEPWFINEQNFAEQAGKKYGFEVIRIGIPDGDKTIAAIDNLAAQGAQGFVICVPDTKLGPAVVNKAKEYKLKVVAVDDRFVGADGKEMEDVVYMGISAAKIGQGVGEALVEEFKNRGWKEEETGLLVSTSDQLETIKQRTDNAKKVVSEMLPGVKIVNSPVKTTDIPGSFDAANIVLTKNPNIKHWLICGGNDEGVQGAVRATEGKGLGASDVIGIGIGGNALEEFMKKEETGFFGTSVISPYRHGYETAEMLYKWIAEDITPPLDTRTSGIIVTRKMDWKAKLKELNLDFQWLHNK